MKILFVSSFIAQYKLAGGVATHLDLLKKASRKRGHLVFHLTSYPPSGEISDFEENIVYVRPALNNSIPFRHNINTLRKYLWIRKHFRPDIIHVHSLTGVGILVLEKRIPVVTTIHALGSLPDKKDRAWLHSLISRCYRVIAGIIKIYQLSCVFNNSDRVIIVSEKTKKDISLTCPGINMNHSEVLSPGIDLSRFKKQAKSIAKKKLGYSNRFVLLYVGRMICGKRPTDILDALISVLPEITNVMAVFIGVGPELAVLEKKTRELKLQEHVMYISGVKNSNLPLYYCAADIFINPTDEDETFGISTGEAMACGTPVLISAKGARTGVVPWDEVCVYSNIDDLARKISLLHGNSAIRDDLSERGLSFVGRYSFIHTEQRINEIYKEILSGRRRKKGSAILKLTVFILVDVFRDIIERLARLRLTK